MPAWSLTECFVCTKDVDVGISNEPKSRLPAWICCQENGRINGRMVEWKPSTSVFLTCFCFILQTENEKDVNGMWKRKNGLIQRESPPGQESPQQVDKAATASLSVPCACTVRLSLILYSYIQHEQRLTGDRGKCCDHHILKTAGVFKVFLFVFICFK